MISRTKRPPRNGRKPTAKPAMQSSRTHARARATLIDLLKREGGVTREEIMSKFKLRSHSAVNHRLKKTVEDAGMYLSTDRKDGPRYRASQVGGPEFLDLERDAAFDLVCALRSLPPFQPSRDDACAARIVNSLLDRLPERVKKELALLEKKVDLGFPSSPHDYRSTLTAFWAAIAERRTLHLTWIDSAKALAARCARQSAPADGAGRATRSSKQFREVDVHGMRWSGREWFAVASDVISGDSTRNRDLRVVALSSVTSCAAGERESSEIPDFDVKSFFAGDLKIGCADEHETSVVIEVDPRCAANFPRMDSSREVQRLQGGGLHSKFRLCGLDDLARFCLALGPDARVMELQQTVSNLATRIARQYD